ncbi:hypothetical protein Nepgr_015445 [Nepenthes gracilis]|uniref:Uncharacterized protein n=1 Tax=Nepenthes gracilis TaxID=150966 RepID=A0AAD3XR44_NEPGR|nr:hypothetical protein Nepgr_015445 [Nepenthes gracilis]
MAVKDLAKVSTQGTFFNKSFCENIAGSQEAMEADMLQQFSQKVEVCCKDVSNRVLLFEELVILFSWRTSDDEVSEFIYTQDIVNMFHEMMAIHTISSGYGLPFHLQKFQPLVNFVM